jgi:hypothetical protein
MNLGFGLMNLKKIFSLTEKPLSLTIQIDTLLIRIALKHQL